MISTSKCTNNITWGKTLEEILPGIIEFRHKLHQIPEMAGQEFKTSQLIRERISRLELDPLAPFLGTDVVVLLSGDRGPGVNVTLRADIDALALKEETQKPYCSTHSQCMHACGHDGHMAMVMGALEVLTRHRHEFAGSVRFIFQPGEENQAMAKELVTAGVLANPTPAVITALHGMPGLPIGTLATRTGAIMASCAHFKITLHGKGGHSSTPELARNPVTTAAALTQELEGMVGRLIDSQTPAVLTICRITGGELANVIPEEAVIEGTIRTLSPQADAILEENFRQTVEAFGSMRGVETKIDYRLSYPVLENTPGATKLAREVIRAGSGRYVELPQSSMAAEDFAYYLKQCPGVYVKIGTGENSPNLHNPHFDFPDAALPYGIEYLVNFTLAALENPEKTAIMYEE